MKVKDFINVALDIANNYKTLYVMGCFGSPLNNSNKQRYKNNYAYNKQLSRSKMIENASYDTFGFDCVCLIKGILWGWNGNVNHVYGGATYASNGVPDVNADAIMNYCYDVSTNFSNIIPGELVHMSGHVGIYIGNGEVVECSPAWKNNVQVTKLSWRKWKNHGKLKFIDYSSSEVHKKSIEQIAEEVIEGRWNVYPKRKQLLESAGYNYKEVQAKVNELLSDKKSYFPKFNSKSIVDGLKSIGANSSFSYRSKIAKANGISGYLGLPNQNIKLLELARNGKLIKP